MTRADRPKYTPASIQAADKLARYLTALFEPQGRVRLIEMIPEVLGPGQGRELTGPFQEWLRRVYGPKTNLTFWAIAPEITASVIVHELMSFARVARLALNATALLRATAAVLRAYAWAQGADARVKGFDIHGAISYVTQGQQSDERTYVLSVLKQYLTGTGYAYSIAEWNDEPGRTKHEVITLLELCAADLEVI